MRAKVALFFGYAMQIWNFKKIIQAKVRLVSSEQSISVILQPICFGNEKSVRSKELIGPMQSGHLIYPNTI